MGKKIKITKEEIPDVELPEGFKIIEIPDPLAEMRKEKERLEKELAEMQEPDEKELANYGRVTHPFFERRMILQFLEEKIKRHENL